MRIGLISDCHLEDPDELPEIYSLLPPRGAVDAFLVAGDATNGGDLLRLCRMIRDALDCPVLVTPGNHEYYHTKAVGISMQELEDRWRLEFALEPGLFFLQDDGVTIGDVSFWGTTWWTNFAALGSDHMQEALATEKMIADFFLILGCELSPAEAEKKLHALNRANGLTRGQQYWQNSGEAFHHLLTARDMIDLNIESVGAYKRWHNSTPGKKVLMAHFPMMPELAHGSLPLHPYFVSQNKTIIESYRPDLLVFGHTHYNHDKEVSGIHCVSNMKVYPPNDPDRHHRPGLILTV